MRELVLPRRLALALGGGLEPTAKSIAAVMAMEHVTPIELVVVTKGLIIMPRLENVNLPA